jgi:Ceramidase
LGPERSPGRLAVDTAFKETWLLINNKYFRMVSIHDFNGKTYCESKSPLAIHDLFGHGSITEVGNALSSLFGMTFFGILGLWIRNYDQDTMSRLLYACLIVNGIGSFLYHGSANSIISSLDGIPMLVLICFGMVSLFDEIAHEKSASKNRNAVKGIVATIAMIYLHFALMAEQYLKGTSVFRVSFGIPMGIYALTMIYLYVKVDDLIQQPVNQSYRSNFRQVLIRGWVSGVGAFTFWLLDLMLCIQSKYVLLFGHWVWHIGIAYFGSCLVAALTFLRGNNHNRHAVIKFIWRGTIPVAYYDDTASIITTRNYDSTSLTSSNSSLLGESSSTTIRAEAWTRY